ncbi:peptidylprolyl isomerase [Roseovarius indicus]|uniref:peptidylprolyl isomerase n=1 Tax=Roseovarius indicus TaxID=540747 RepID=UPI0007D8D568|nr:peptidylprolyl isomerase [Roseovarius indicus]OAO06688.1 peptidylprolyl isomerase [Roseovarius indicus]
MPATFRPILAAAFAAAMALSPAAKAQETADPSEVLATVNGTEITLGHVIAVRADLPRQYDQFPPALLFEGIIDQLIQQTLLQQSFEGDLSLQSQILLENEERAVTAGEVISEVMAGGLDEDALKAAYEEQYPDEAGETEYRASHILVETEEEAQDLVTQLEDGADFAALAREHSTGPSAPSGGDLGWFGEGDMVQPFFEAVAALEPGGVSGPVETQFGWHVVTLAETREKERPEFETVRDELASQAREQMLTAHVEKLSEDAQIDRADISGINPEAINDTSLLEN